MKSKHFKRKLRDLRQGHSYVRVWGEVLTRKKPLLADTPTVRYMYVAAHDVFVRMYVERCWVGVHGTAKRRHLCCQTHCGHILNGSHGPVFNNMNAAEKYLAALKEPNALFLSDITDYEDLYDY